MEEVINLEVYDPRGKWVGRGCDTEYVQIGWCRNSKNCDVYKQGKCVMFSNFGYEDGGIDRTGCPYGRKEIKTGFTKRAAKCGQLVEKALQELGDKLNAVKGLWHDDELVSIGDYIRIDSRVELFFQTILPEDQYFERNMIKKEAFTPELVAKMVKLREWQLPDNLRSKFRTARQLHLVGFLKMLQKKNPDMFKEVRMLCPTVNEMVACRDISRYFNGYCAGCQHYIWGGGGCSLCKGK